MPSSTVEDYLKHLYLLQQKKGRSGRSVALGKLAEALNVTPGTATAMVKTLAGSGLVDYTPRAGVRLTAAGQSLSLLVLRRHRLVELLLVRVLGLDWSEVHQEAEELEHAISDKVLERIDALLGYPSTDPHGDPIPTAEGEVLPQSLKSLADCALNQTVRVVRVLDQDPAFLQFAEHHGLTPGMDLLVQERNSAADAITCRLGTAPSSELITLGSAAAAKFLVELATEAPAPKEKTSLGSNG